MSDMERLNKMKVTELRDELKKKGLETKGNKSVLVKRLHDAIAGDSGVEPSTDAPAVGADESYGEDSQDDSQIDQDLSQSEPMQEEPEVKEESEPATNSMPTEAKPAVKTEEKALKMEQEELKIEEELLKTEEELLKTEEELLKPDEPVVKKEEQMVVQEGHQENGDEAPAADDVGEEYQTIDETGDTEEKDDDKKHSQKRKRSRSRSRERRRSRDRERHRSRSRSRERNRRPPPEMDDESWESDTAFKFDRYNCDLTIRIDENGVKAHPLTVEGFAFMWAGARTMFGVNSGKVAYEVKLLENLNVDHLPAEESNPHVLRVGWSTDSTSLQLGEEPLSYGYGGTGKASTECKFKDYGQAFTEGDVITAYLDMESDPIIMSYSKNGEDLGTCFEVDKSSIGDAALFPHILTKNTEFECNFGQNEEPWFPLTEGFSFITSVEEDKRVRGSTPPAKKEDCEILMMVGLPGAGKTHWAEKHTAANPDNKYFVLGTNNIIDKMKVMGLPRKKNYAGRWDVLIDKSTKCLNRMIEIAARKKHNYILDQTNVYASARRRKMQPFEGFQRKAVVVVPTEEDFKTRTELREKEEGKEVPEKAVLEMKANFTLPETGGLFDEIIYTDLDGDECKELVEKYRKEAQKLLPPPEKRWRGGDRFSGGRGGYSYDRRGGGYHSGGDRDRYGSRGGYRDRGHRGGGSSYRGGDGGYRSYGGGSGGGGRYNDRYQDNRRSSYGSSDRSYDRNQSRNRSGGGGYGQSSSWNSKGAWGSGNQGSSWGGNQNQWSGQGSWGHQGQSGYGQNWNAYNQNPQSSQGYGQNWNQPQNWGQGYGSGSSGSSGWGNQGSYGSGQYNQYYGSYQK
ncbi:heterogeneous nuclear ribonucleoprotein U-like protein 1 isoform X2 [Gigantopelta aegis]|uniref:heterogeneous nuclear ribonucleoprotein U-like protein 1 isoform X2 n=1 Tax=Gigantopelta aegis TaxID=1735272 RepID=UPI001B88D24F|nr:heterogeneous nuclear ribonucleoprotein U-like protein 1 isoform X2 [Gigantopelta aegis]